MFDAHVTDGETMRLDVLPTGDVLYGGGSYDGPFVSLTGLTFAVKESDGSPLKLAAPWTSYDETWARPRITMQDELCVLSGMIRVESVQLWSENLLTVPQDCRPRNGKRVFMINSDRNSHRVELDQDGVLKWIAGGKVLPWVSLNGITYFPSSTNALPLEPGFQNFAQGYQTATVRKMGTLCVLSGMVSGLGGRRHVATLGENCRPAGILVFAVNQNEASLRFDVHPDGRIVWQSGHNHYGWASLDGIHFIADGQPFGRVRTEPIEWQQGELRLWNSFTAAGGSLARPQYSRFGHLCMIEGVISRNGSADFNDAFLRLPRDCRPERRLVLDIHNQQGDTMRVDVNNDGIVRWVAGQRQASTVSFAGTLFAAYGGPSADLTPLPPWVHYERGFTQAQVTIQGDMCVVEGLIRVDDWDVNKFSNSLVQLPTECNPSGRLVFNTNYGRSTDRIDVRVLVLQFTDAAAHLRLRFLFFLGAGQRFGSMGRRQQSPISVVITHGYLLLAVARPEHAARCRLEGSRR